VKIGFTAAFKLVGFPSGKKTTVLYMFPLMLWRHSCISIVRKPAVMYLFSCDCFALVFSQQKHDRCCFQNNFCLASRPKRHPNCTYHNEQYEVDEAVKRVSIHYKIHNIHPSFKTYNLWNFNTVSLQIAIALFHNSFGNLLQYTPTNVNDAKCTERTIFHHFRTKLLSSKTNKNCKIKHAWQS